MTTTNWIPETLQPHFVRWVTLWHGDCDKPGHKHNQCEIAPKLRQYEEGKATFQQLFDVVIDTDLDWEESWENYRKYNKI